MRRCARCRSSVVVEPSYDVGDPELIWKCLGCGRETFVDPARQADDERLRRSIATARPTTRAALAGSGLWRSA